MTENKQKNEIENTLIAQGLDFTIFEAEGTWKGVRERSLVIEFEGATLGKVLVAAQEIRKLNNQEAVLVQAIQTDLYEVTEGDYKKL